MARRAISRLPAATAPTEWVIASDILAIDDVVAAVVRVGTAAGFSARQCRFNIPVALTEALSNAIMRGNCGEPSRRVTIRTAVEQMATGASLIVEVTDEGEGFDLGTAGSRPGDTDWLDREDGRGVFLMQSLMDRVECSRSAGRPGNTVRLILHRT